MYCAAGRIKVTAAAASVEEQRAKKCGEGGCGEGTRKCGERLFRRCEEKQGETTLNTVSSEPVERSGRRGCLVGHGARRSPRFSFFSLSWFFPRPLQVQAFGLGRIGQSASISICTWGPGWFRLVGADGQHSSHPSRVGGCRRRMKNALPQTRRGPGPGPGSIDTPDVIPHR